MSRQLGPFRRFSDGVTQRHREPLNVMRAILSTLVAASLLGHAIADASRHQPRQCAECNSAAVATLAADRCRHDEGTHRREHPPGRPCNCQLDCVGGCTYLPPQKVALEATDLLSPLVVADYSAIPSVGSSLAGHSLASHGMWAFESPPLRRHLLLQILLI